jgi:hypothetical protein
VTSTTTPATFNVSNLTVTPAKVSLGQIVTISVLAENTGDLSGTYYIALKIDGVATDNKILNLAAQTKDMVIFTVSRDNIGEYSIDINGLAGKFTVAMLPATSTSPPPAKKIPLWVIFVGVGAFTLAIIATISLGLRRRRS